VTDTRRPVSWLPEVLLLAGFVALTLALAAGHFLRLDVVVRDWCDTHIGLRPLAKVLNYLGQGGALSLLCAVLAVALAWLRHSIRPVFPVAAAFVLTTAVILPLKTVTARPAPHAGDHVERFGLGGVSYPSGHLVNTLVWYGVLVLLLAPWLPEVGRRVIRVTPPVVVSVTTVYLGWHWLSDTVAGLLLGYLLDRLLRRVDWDRVPLGRRLSDSGWAGSGFAQGARPRAQFRA
jgi:membrane-associated phospholipid phosphatase